MCRRTQARGLSSLAANAPSVSLWHWSVVHSVWGVAWAEGERGSFIANVLVWKLFSRIDLLP